MRGTYFRRSSEWELCELMLKLQPFFARSFSRNLQTFKDTVTSEPVSGYFESPTELIEVDQIVFGHDGYDFTQRCGA